MPLLVVLTGPSGVGKDTVAARLQALFSLERVLTCTSRPRREGEEDGVHYRFLGSDEFAEWVGAGRFVEHATVYGHRYGILRSDLAGPLSAGQDLIVLLDVQGARTVKSAFPEAWVAFLEPPDEEELARRLDARGGEGDEDRRRRLEMAPAELTLRSDPGLVDATFTNDDLDACVDRLAAAIGPLLAGGSGRG